MEIKPEMVDTKVDVMETLKDELIKSESFITAVMTRAQIVKEQEGIKPLHTPEVSISNIQIDRAKLMELQNNDVNIKKLVDKIPVINSKHEISYHVENGLIMRHFTDVLNAKDVVKQVVVKSLQKSRSAILDFFNKHIFRHLSIWECSIWSMIYVMIYA